jgi:hypothetical protein
LLVAFGKTAPTLAYRIIAENFRLISKSLWQGARGGEELWIEAAADLFLARRCGEGNSKP